MGDTAISDQDDGVEPGEYCRQVEAYLCRKNQGHLVRIAGPSFTRVCGWAEQGIPLNAVYRGIDRYCERYYAKGARRRPVLIDFCEHDVLDVFDEWRRAVGVFDASAGPAPPIAHTSLPVHLERVITRLTTMRAGGRLAAEVHAAVDAAVREVDRMRATAAHVRGEARAAAIARLAALDVEIAAALRASLAGPEWDGLVGEAERELARFRGSMAPDAYERALDASTIRLLRERTGLPVIKYEE